jgi:alpha-amylase/alpha-mannosidase (GH57 family)
MGCFACIHCHFYQPPRENAWLEAVESQDSASPYHDWNERITAECYLANGASRMLDGHGRIAKIVNNYTRISFNFGPTLLSWMEERAPQAYTQVLKADRESQQIFSGHGSAIAQAYNHLILPLANSRDKRTHSRLHGDSKLGVHLCIGNLHGNSRPVPSERWVGKLVCLS